MIRLSTRFKLRVARVLLFIVQPGLWLLGNRGRPLVCRRFGARWSLNLSQGVDFAIFLFGRHEPRAQKLLKNYVKPGMVVCDIGANIGSYTLPLAMLVGSEGKVVAIEPTDWAFDRLQQNIALNPDLARRVVPHQALLVKGDEPVDALKEVFASWSLVEAGHAVHGGQLRSTSRARRLTLDQLMTEMSLAKVDFIKLDVDGHECHVLAGAKESLRKFRPPLLMEFCPHVLEEHGSNLPELVRILQTLGYSCAIDESGHEFSLSLPTIESRIPVNGSMNALLR